MKLVQFGRALNVSLRFSAWVEKGITVSSMAPFTVYRYGDDESPAVQTYALPLTMLPGTTISVGFGVVLEYTAAGPGGSTRDQLFGAATHQEFSDPQTFLWDLTLTGDGVAIKNPHPGSNSWGSEDFRLEFIPYSAASGGGGSAEIGIQAKLIAINQQGGSFQADAKVGDFGSVKYSPPVFTPVAEQVSPQVKLVFKDQRTKPAPPSPAPVKQVPIVLPLNIQRCLIGPYPMGNAQLDHPALGTNPRAQLDRWLSTVKSNAELFGAIIRPGVDGINKSIILVYGSADGVGGRAVDEGKARERADVVVKAIQTRLQNSGANIVSASNGGTDADGNPFPPIDLPALRNVLIYIDMERLMDVILYMRDHPKK